MSDGRMLSHDVLEAYRLSAIKLHQKGVSVPILAQSFGVERQAVYKWLQKFKRKGRKSLYAVKGNGRPPILNESYFSEFKTLLKKPATQLGYATDLWSGPRGGQHIGVTGAVSQQGRLLFELTADDENFTARVFLRFVRKMQREHPNRNMALIVDGSPVHILYYDLSKKILISLRLFLCHKSRLNYVTYYIKLPS